MWLWLVYLLPLFALARAVDRLRVTLRSRDPMAEWSAFTEAARRLQEWDR